MHALLLDFQNTRRKPGVIGVLILFGGVSISVLLAILIYRNLNDIGILTTRLSLIEQQSEHVTVSRHLSPEEVQQQRAEIKDAKAVLSQLGLPWDRLFTDIGASQQKHIALLAIVPDAPKRTLKITGEAKNLNALLEYLRQLQKAKSLRSVYLQNHKVELTSPERPVHFTVIATWVVSP